MALAAGSHLTPAPSAIAAVVAAEQTVVGGGPAAPNQVLVEKKGTAAEVSTGSADADGERAAAGLAASHDAAPISGSGGATAGATEATTATQGAAVFSFSGSGQSMSKPFTVDDSWQITWDHPGSNLFSLQLIPAGSGAYGTLIVSEVGASSGQSPIYVKGTFTLRAVSPDQWSVRVVDLVSRPVASLPAMFRGSGPSNSPTFTTTRPWLLEWTLDRYSTISVDLVPLAARTPATVVVDAISARTGCAEVSDLGAFYLSVDTDAEWQLQTSMTDGEVVCPVR